MGTVKAIQAEPELGICHFRATNKWVDGAFNQSRITGFYGAKQEIAHKQAFHLVADEPPILAGNDDGANPVEHLLHALASCLTTSMVAHAAVRGIEIEEMESELEGDLNLNGFLDLISNFLRATSARFGEDLGSNTIRTRFFYSASFKLEILKTVLEDFSLKKL